MHCPWLQIFWLQPCVTRLIQFTSVGTRAKNVLELMKQLGIATDDATPTNLTSDVLGSIQARGPKERQKIEKLTGFTLPMAMGLGF